MEITINPSIANGTIKAQPSKSIVHRLLICAALSDGISTISNVAFSEDILATIDCIKALGASVEVSDTKDSLTIRGITFPFAQKEVDFFCRESGSTMRFFMPIAMALGIRARFFGSERLLERPFDVYESICRKQGIVFEKKDDCIVIEGKLQPDHFEIPGNISSQFISGLLFALPLLHTDSSIRLLPPVESASYIDLTRRTLEQFGITVVYDGSYQIKGDQTYCGNTIEAEGDYSNAAFLDALNLLGGNVFVTGLDEKSMQGDRVYREYFEKLKAGTSVLDLSDCPDLGPVLIAMAAYLHGGILNGTKRLRMKESDRGRAMEEELKKCGIELYIEDDRITVPYVSLKAPHEKLDGHNDHRIVMALAVLLTKLGGTITGAEAVKKSYPYFFEDLVKLGVDVSVREESQ